jgi:hypothetical protein
MPKSGKVRAVPMATEVAQALAALLTDRGNPGPEELQQQLAQMAETLSRVQARQQASA